MKNIFSNIGDKDVTELYQSLRLGIIRIVDETKATVTIEWLDKSGIRTEIPISMPYCEQGWGIYIMPRKNSIVVCGIRPYEFPIILAYVPPNFMTPYSFWSQYKQVSNLEPLNTEPPNHKTLRSGELILRNLIDKAKCKSCGNVSSLSDWASMIGYDTLEDKIIVEKCPICYAPAIVIQDDKITKVNKIQMGILLYLQKDGKMRIKLNDGLDANDIGKGSLIDIKFDENSNLDIVGIQNETVESKQSHEKTDYKLIECGNIDLGDNSAITIGQAKKIIDIMNRLITEIKTHWHLGNMGAPTSIPQTSFTTPTQSEIETTKTKAS